MPLKELGSVENIFKTLAHHDGQLGQLAARVGGVETALVSLDKKFDLTHNETSNVLKDIQKSLTQTQARQGPGFMQIVYGCAGGATVLGIICSGITMLVSAQFSGPMTAMQTTLATLVESKKDSDSADAQELRDYKKMRRADVDKFKDDAAAKLNDVAARLSALEERREWVTATATRAARK